MKTKILYFGIAVLILVIAGAYVYGRQSEAPPTETQSNSTTTPPQDEMVTAPETPDQTEEPAPPAQTPTPPPSSGGSTGRFVGEEETSAPDIMVHEVTYNGTVFSPSSLTIKAGDIVIFKNASSAGFRPASDPHPSHTNYPGFDSNASVASGLSFEFKFNKVGTWGYHDHFNAAARGTIIVK